MGEEWPDRYLGRSAEISEKELCPKCGRPWQEPAGVSLDYNAFRRRVTTETFSLEGYRAERIENDRLGPWEELLAETIGDPKDYLVCANCISDEGALPSHPSRPWYRDE